MHEILTEKHKVAYLDYFKINKNSFYKRRILMVFALLFAYGVLYYTFENSLLLIGVPVVMFLGYKIPYIELLMKMNQNELLKQFHFPTFLRYFIALIETQGNVYRTLKAVVPYINDPLKSDLKILIGKLESSNTNNRDAFMDFADSIDSSEARMIIGMIYEFNEEGISKEDIKELENTIDQLQENKINELIEYKVSRIERHADPLLVYALSYIFIFTILVQYAYLGEIF